MDWRGFLHVALLTLAVGGALFFWLAPKDAFNPAEAALFERLDKVNPDHELTAADFVEAFGLPDKCRAGDCYVEKSAIPALGGPRLHLRRGDGGAIFTIQGLDRVCIRTDRATVKYPGGKIEDNCRDASCPSYNIRQREGLLGFLWPDRKSNCIRDIVINTERWFR
ncbi:hypothetical protein V6U71_12660 [Sphingopyxis sp. J-6]|uniref:hypothetical protein n=1 Tax=Sphingopyxis sp. J-6 TaxID=3122054 RepID=UPI003983E5AA